MFYLLKSCVVAKGEKHGLQVRRRVAAVRSQSLAVVIRWPVCSCFTGRVMVHQEMFAGSLLVEQEPPLWFHLYAINK